VKWARHGRVLPIEPCTWVTEQNKDEAQCGCWKWSVYCEETHLRQVWLGTFFSGKLNCLVSWKRDLILQCLSQRFCSYFTYKCKWQMSFFSATLFRVDSKRLNKFSILTRRIKITKMLFLHFCTNWPTVLLFFLSATLIITLTTKCKTNLILDKTNKINSLQ